MPYLSLTDLVDVVSKAGVPKATKVAQIKNRGEYDPVTDFYKAFRERLVGLHKQGGDREGLKNICLSVPDQKKLENYTSLVSGYRKWWGKKSLAWFVPAADTYSNHGVDVSVNPELGLEVNGQPFLIKLYLKDEKLSKHRIDLITALMEMRLRSKVNGAIQMSVLDVRSSKLHIYKASGQNLRPLIDAEMSYIAQLWPHV